MGKKKGQAKGNSDEKKKKKPSSATQASSSEQSEEPKPQSQGSKQQSEESRLSSEQKQLSPQSLAQSPRPKSQAQVATPQPQTASQQPQGAWQQPQGAWQQPQGAWQQTKGASQHAQGAWQQPQTPQKQPQTPQKQPQTPQKQPQTPQKQPQTPQKQPQTPQKQSQTPQKQSQTPQKQFQTPQKQSQTPQKQSQTPQKQSQTPQKQSQTPQKLLQTPQKQSKTPQKQSQTPQKQSQTPQKQSQTPQKLLQTPQKQSPRPKQQKSVDSKNSPSEFVPDAMDLGTTWIPVAKRLQEETFKEQDQQEMQVHKKGPKYHSHQPSPKKIKSVDQLADQLASSYLSPSKSAVPSSSTSPIQIIPSKAKIRVEGNKGIGNAGKPVMIDVNFLSLKIEKLLPKVYQYDVTIDPKLPKRLLPLVFQEYRRKNFKNTFIAFDGQKIAVSPKVLPINENTEKNCTVTDENGRQRVYVVTMKEANDYEIDFESLKSYTTLRQYDAPLRAIQMLEIVLKSAFLNKEGIHSGRSFYMPMERPMDLGDNYELWTGLYQSTVLGSRPYLNVDIAHKAFPSERSIIKILDLMRVDLSRNLDKMSRDVLNSHLKGLLINYFMPGQTFPRRTYKFLQFEKSADTFKFICNTEKKEYTVTDYFHKRGVRLLYPHLPTVQLGKQEKPITVPIECCTVAGYQTVNKKCTEMQTRNMIKEAATSTDQRKMKIMEMLRQIKHNETESLKQFKVEVGDAFEQIRARVLEAPHLEYAQQQIIQPTRGQWRTDNLKFLKASPLTRYVVLIMDRRTNTDRVREFCDKICSTGREFGMNIEPKCSISTLQIQQTSSKEFKPELERLMSGWIKEKIELIFCIIPDMGDTYSKVKQCAELRCGILTQCVKATTIFRKGTDQSTISNIILKVNAKLNGTNHKFGVNSRLALMSKPFMIIGADVTHPSPGQETIPSVVGVVSSHDLHGFQYNKCWRLQDPKQEIIKDFAEIIKEHLAFFEHRLRRLPEIILYFRDGVSEGQFQRVLDEELNAIETGCSQYRHGYKPNITFIVVQKRHHTRFFPPFRSDLGRGDSRNNNVPPGTIVDSQITHPNETQFYLISHQSIQGVARPTKYCVLKDASKLPIDELQKITYNLCHFFARCTRSVSYPAPTYYAHLAASRGRVYIEGDILNMNNLERELNNRTVKEAIAKLHPMYFI